VTADEVELPTGQHLGQGVGVALQGHHAVGDPGLPRPPCQGGQGIGTGVDNGDRFDHVGTEARERDGELSGAAAEVENAQRSIEGRSLGLDEVVDARPQRSRAQSDSGAARST
jgi:hypothetical protein